MDTESETLDLLLHLHQNVIAIHPRHVWDDEAPKSYSAWDVIEYMNRSDSNNIAHQVKRVIAIIHELIRFLDRRAAGYHLVFMFIYNFQVTFKLTRKETVIIISSDD